MDFFIGHYNYWIVIFLMMVGLYTVISRGNLIKKIIGLNIFQVSDRKSTRLNSSHRPNT